MRLAFRTVLAMSLSMSLAPLALANDTHSPSFPAKETTMLQARGDFDVTLTPHAGPEGGPEFGRMGIHKVFHGELDGSCEGEMLSVMTATKGSGAYVALDRFTGTLAGRRGSFMLMHYATMTRGAPQLSVTVVPDSGTDELAGLSGTLAIHIDDKGAHSYTFDYAIN
ncbi:MULTISPECIES: DUF3224 domain-containing protein [Dyella]|nr:MULTISPECIES: DUF3224 domain-containing protein [Dyella]